MSKIDHWKANANVVWLVAAVVGLFTINAVRVALRPNVWTDDHTRGKSRAAADILHLHNTIERLHQSLPSAPHRYALFRLSTAIDNATILEEALVERISLLDQHHRVRRVIRQGVQMQDIPEIVASVRLQLDLTVRYIGSGCIGNGPAISSADWFDDQLISRFSAADRAHLVVDDVCLDNDQTAGGSQVDRSGSPLALDGRLDQRRVAGSESVVPDGPVPNPDRTLRLIRGGRA